MASHPTFTERAYFWWANRTGVQVLVVVVMTSLATIGFVKPSLVTDLWKPAPVEVVSKTKGTAPAVTNSSPRVRPPNVQRYDAQQGGCVLVASLDQAGEMDFFNQNSLAALRRVAEGLVDLPQIQSVSWMDNVPDFNLFSLNGSLLPPRNASERQVLSAREKVLKNPLAVGQLISPDGKTVLMHLSIRWIEVTSDDDITHAVRRKAEELAGKPANAKETIKFQVTGSIPLDAMTAHNHMVDSTKYQLIGYAIMMISALVLFRGLSAVIIVAIAPGFGVFWTMGMLHFWELENNPFNDIIVPVLISLVGLTDAVHLMVEIRNQRASGLSSHEAAKAGIARVGSACFLTSLTTAIGFISLYWAHHQVVREFGVCCIIGVTLTFISVLTVVPLGCRSPLGKRLHVGMGKSLVDGQLRKIEPVVDFVLRHDRWVALFSIVLTVIMVLIATRLVPDEKRFSGLSESGEAAQALRHLDHALGGLEFGEINVNWSAEKNEGEVLENLKRVDAILADEPLIGHPVGLRDLLDALPGDGDASDRMALLDLLPPSLKRAFYTPEHHQSKIQFRIQDLGIAAYGPTFTRIEKRLEQLNAAQPGFYFSLEGGAVWRWRNIYQIVTDLANSLGTAAIVIWLVMTVAYRSIRLGLISLIPNVFPLAVTAAALVFLGQRLEIVTVCVFTICLGIAVDDTIHFLTRYREEMRKGGDHQAIIRRAFTGVGMALIMTTVVLVAGMGSAIFGDSRDARLFGIMGCVTLVAALFGDVLMLPAMLKCLAKKPPETKA